MVILLILSTLSPLFSQGGFFPDVPTDHWAYPCVHDLWKKGILKGYPDGTFKGDRPITRYEMAVAIASAMEYLQLKIEKSKETQEILSILGGSKEKPASLTDMAKGLAYLLEKFALEKLSLEAPPASPKPVD